jgi:hypothetical protein
MNIIFKKTIRETTEKTISNPFYKSEAHTVNDNDLEKVIDTVNYYKSKYGNNELFNDAISGAGVYLVIVSKNGNIHPYNIKTPNYRFHPSDVGNVTGTANDNIMILIRASKIDKLTGAAVARIKTYVIFGDYIIDRVKTQTKDSYLDNDIEIKQKSDKFIEKKSRLDSLDDFKQKAKQISKILTQQQKDQILKQFATNNNINPLELGPRERISIFLDWLENN